MAEGLPELDVNVRIIHPRSAAAADSTEDSLLKGFAGARDLWMGQAGINLRLWGDAVEQPISEEFSGQVAVARRQEALAAFTNVHQPYILVLCVDLYAGDEVTPKAYTYFPQPWIGESGVGIIGTPAGLAANLPHEIGHALGLPHTWYTRTVYERKSPDVGIFSMVPFTDDTTDFTEEEDAANLMTDTGGDHPTGALTRNQVARARLTVVSRRCGYSQVFSGNLSDSELAVRYPLVPDYTARTAGWMLQ